MSAHYDVDFINPILHAVMNVLGTMANVPVTMGRPYINRKRSAEGDITGLIGVTGHAKGAISLTLDKGAILQIVNNMLYESYTDLNEEIGDAVGELTNMIAGQARGELSKQGMSFKASTPTVITGRGHTIRHVTGAPILSIPFTTEAGRLVVELSFAECREMDASLARGQVPEAGQVSEAGEVPAAGQPSGDRK